MPVQTGRQLRDLAAERRWSVDFSAWQYLGTEMEVPRRRCPSARPEFCGATTREQRKTWRRRCHPPKLAGCAQRCGGSSVRRCRLKCSRRLVGSLARVRRSTARLSRRDESCRVRTPGAAGQQDSRTALNQMRISSSGRQDGCEITLVIWVRASVFVALASRTPWSWRW